MNALIKTKDELAVMKMGGKILSATLDKIEQTIKPGVALSELDRIAEESIVQGGGVPSFLGYQPEGADEPYPASICTSVNEYVVHGLPGDYRLRRGDIISIDLGVKFKGFHTDSARTVAVGKISGPARNLMEVTEATLYQGIRRAVAGKTLGDIGHAISEFAKKNKVTVVKGLTGHGVGRELHEHPTVFNFGKPGEGMMLEAGMTLAIEPMLSLQSGDIVQETDGSYKTADGSLSAHFEHTIAITDGEPLILTK